MMKPARKRILLVMIAILIAELILWGWLTQRPGEASPAENAGQPGGKAPRADNRAASAGGAVEQAAEPFARPHPMAAAFGSAQFDPEQEPGVLLEMLQAYRRAAGTYPTAEDNPALMRILTHSAKGLRLFPADHPRLDADGALVDAWGTPFFFHHLSSLDLEIRSAGPDREWFTADDLVAADPGPIKAPGTADR